MDPFAAKSHTTFGAHLRGPTCGGYVRGGMTLKIEISDQTGEVIAPVAAYNFSV